MSQGITRAQSVGRQVRAALAEHGMNQTQLALALGVTIDAVSRRLTGKVSFRADELMQIAEVLGERAARFVEPLPHSRLRDHDPHPGAAEAATVPAPRRGTDELKPVPTRAGAA